MTQLLARVDTLANAKNVVNLDDPVPEAQAYAGQGGGWPTQGVNDTQGVNVATADRCNIDRRYHDIIDTYPLRFR